MEKDDQRRMDEDLRETLKPTGGRDELNLAEFPITLLSDRVPKGCKTLVFEIEPRDRQSGQPVSRKVTITGGDAYGLPTAIDDEILVSLVQLTKLKNDFTDPTVFFSRYELVELLGWEHNGRSYRRIEESIKRWVGVTLYYDNAWWNKETGTWVSETFHVIERSSLIDRETKRVRIASGQSELALSFFKWNEVIFRSFQAGSLKRLDIDAYFSYSTSIAKRMYRFLDKRFWIKPRWEFDLKEFAFEHIGLSRKYDVAQIKNKLRAAIDELCKCTTERDAFLEPMAIKERYEKIGKGRWLVRFARKTTPRAPSPAPASVPQGLAAELVARGVSSEVAEDLVKTTDVEFIKHRIEIFDWVMAQPKQRVIKESPPGYLIDSIKNRYLTAPKGFVGRAEREREQNAQRQAAKKAAKEKAQKSRDDARMREEQLAVKKYWEGLSDEERDALLAAAGISNEPIAPNDFMAKFQRTYQRESYIRKLLGLPVEELMDGDG